jgi:hypothetical protein
MKRTFLRTVAVLVVGGALLSGCGRAAKHRDTSSVPAAPGTSAPAVVVTPSPIAATGAGNGTGGSVDSRLNDVNGLLSQVDGQVSADNQTPGDSD